MSDPPESDGPRLFTTDGQPIELPPIPRRPSSEDATRATDAPASLWWSLSRPDGGGVNIKATLIDYDHWDITDVYIHGPQVTATDIHGVPLTQMNLLMNLIGYWGEESGIPAGQFMDGDAIADAINDFAAKAGYGPAVRYHVPEETGTGDPTLAELRGLAADAPPELPRLPAAERPRLTRPDGTDPDGFAAKVAAAYREYATQTRAVAIEIANEAGVPVPTARSWIREARRRGKLPQGQKGKTG